MRAGGQSRPDDRVLRRFLLGELAEPDRERVEQQFFEDADCFERVLQIEEDLLAAYDRNTLGQEDRASFERQYFATAEGRQRIALGRAALAPSPQSDAPAGSRVAAGKARWWLVAGPQRLRLALGAAALVVMAVGLWAWSNNRLLHQQLADSAAQYARLRQVEQDLRREIADGGERTARLTEEIARARSAGAAAGRGPVVSLMLSPGLPRGSTAAALTIRRDTSLVVLQLEPETGETYDAFRAVLTVDGREVWQQEFAAPNPSSSGQPVAVTLPAARLQPGEHLLTLHGRTRGDMREIALYYFLVVRQP
jgi:hypothetical protein